MTHSPSVEVRCRFDGAWVSGFEVAAAEGTGAQRRLRLRRVSDGVVLPEPFRPEDVRPPAQRLEQLGHDRYRQ